MEADISTIDQLIRNNASEADIKGVLDNSSNAQSVLTKTHLFQRANGTLLEDCFFHYFVFKNYQTILNQYIRLIDRLEIFSIMASNSGEKNNVFLLGAKSAVENNDLSALELLVRHFRETHSSGQIFADTEISTMLAMANSRGETILTIFLDAIISEFNTMQDDNDRVIMMYQMINDFINKYDTVIANGCFSEDKTFRGITNLYQRRIYRLKNLEDILEGSTISEMNWTMSEKLESMMNRIEIPRDYMEEMRRAITSNNTEMIIRKVNFCNRIIYENFAEDMPVVLKCIEKNLSAVVERIVTIVCVSKRDVRKFYRLARIGDNTFLHFAARARSCMFSHFEELFQRQASSEIVRRNFGGTPLEIVLKKITDMFAYLPTAEDVPEERYEEALGELRQTYEDVRDCLVECPLILKHSLNYKADVYRRLIGDVQIIEYEVGFDDEEVFDNDVGWMENVYTEEDLNVETMEFFQSSLSVILERYYDMETSARRNLMMDLDASVAKLGEIYTIEDFLWRTFPEEKDRFHLYMPEVKDGALVRKDVDCDIGDATGSKFMPVKIDVINTGSTNGRWIRRHTWESSVDEGVETVRVFCAEDLKRYLSTRKGSYGLSVDDGDEYYEDNAYFDTSPFSKRKIKGIQYLTKKEIEEEEAKHIQILRTKMKKMESKGRLRAAVASSQEDRGSLKEDPYKDARDLLQKDSKLAILKRQLDRAVKSLEELYEEAQKSGQEVDPDEVQSIRNRIEMFRQMIAGLRKRDRDENADDGNSPKNQRTQMKESLVNLRF